MPELPEVETMRRGLEPCVGMRIDDVEAVRTARRPIAIAPRPVILKRRLVDRTIAATGRLGKRVVLRLDNGESLVFEPRMTGLVLTAAPPSMEHLRLRLRLSGRRPSAKIDLLYWDRRGLGSVRLMTPDEVEDAFGPERLGPDALNVTAHVLSERLGASRRAIKVALLDQRAIAGIGNLYAAEALYIAGLNPTIACNRLRPTEWQRLSIAILRILREAIRYEGSTLADGTYRNALNQEGTYQNHHRVYDRAGQRCRRCRKHEIVRIVQAQRATFYCPTCQPAGRG